MCQTAMKREEVKRDEASARSDPETQMDTVSDKVTRTSKLLHEIQDLSPICKEDQRNIKEREVGHQYRCYIDIASEMRCY